MGLQKKPKQTERHASSLFYREFTHQTFTNHWFKMLPIFWSPFLPPVYYCPQSRAGKPSMCSCPHCFQVWQPSLYPSSTDIRGLLHKPSIKLSYVYGDLSDHLAACFIALCVCKGKSSPTSPSVKPSGTSVSRSANSPCRTKGIISTNILKLKEWLSTSLACGVWSGLKLPTWIYLFTGKNRHLNWQSVPTFFFF